MSTFEPLPAEFAPSQQRGPDIAIYIFPQNHALCYEWSFRHMFADRQTKTYICCGCRALKNARPQQYTDPIPSCRIKGGNFITDPAHPARPHFCEPRNTPRATMRRIIIAKCNDLRESKSRRPTSVIVQELIQQVSSPRFQDYPDTERREMVTHLSCPTERGADNLNRNIRRNIRRGQQDVVPGALDRTLCRCAADGKEFILHDDNGVIFIASRTLWNDVFNTLNLRTVAADGRFKQIPPELNPTRTSQLYTIIGEVDGGHHLPLLYAFLPDGKEDTYRSIWFRSQIAPLGGVAAIEAGSCKFITDFELPAINALRATFNVNYHGCLFHYAQCILTKEQRRLPAMSRLFHQQSRFSFLQKAASTASATPSISCDL
ncbi:hypothetical protein Q1695_014187 [Nippostrongylus brasiliensis]|nr:hypothetical protein Q1695_014187 [Nippostrongylus brasiliensis]